MKTKTFIFQTEETCIAMTVFILPNKTANVCYMYPRSPSMSVSTSDAKKAFDFRKEDIIGFVESRYSTLGAY